MQDGAEQLEIINKIMEQKEIIKKASQEIIGKIDDPRADVYIHSRILEILTAVSNIGIIANESDRLYNFIHSWKAFVESTLALEQRQLRAPIIMHALNMMCTISFNVKKKGSRYKINIPKLDVNVFKFG